MPRIAISEIPDTGSKIFELEGRRVLICRGSSGIRVMNEMCPHQTLSLDGARVRGNFIMCPHHGARFDLQDGQSLSPLTRQPLNFFATHIEGEDLVIEFGS